MIILLCSKLPQQGKDSACSFICENFNGIRVAFADEVKNIAKQLGWNGEKDEKGRQLLIDVGCMARKYNKNIWVEKTIPKLNLNSSNNKNTVYSDFRFKSELDTLKSKYSNIIVIGIESDILGDKRFEFDESQIEYKDISKDYIIKNNGTLQDFYSELNDILRNIIK